MVCWELDTIYNDDNDDIMMRKMMGSMMKKSMMVLIINTIMIKAIIKTIMSHIRMTKT